MLDPLTPPLEVANTPTAIESLEHISDRYGPSVYIKRDDRTAGPAQGNKIRKLEYELGTALQSSADVVVTGGGTQSNHCRATALLAARHDIDVQLVLLGEQPAVPDGNYLLDWLCTDHIEFVPESEFVGWERALEAAADRWRDRGRTPHIIPLGASTPKGSLGYVRAYREIAGWLETVDVELDRIVVPTGSGGTHAGLLAASLSQNGPAITGIDVTPYGRTHQERTIKSLVDGIFELLEVSAPAGIESAIDVRTGYVGPGYGEPSPADCEMIAELARAEGIVLDPTYTGKAFRALLELADPQETVLFVHTGGSYGLFPHRMELTDISLEGS